MGRPTFSYLRELEQSQWLSRKDLEAYQLRKLGELLRSAAAHSFWYRERMDAAEIPLKGDLTFTDLRRLPTLTKADAKANRERMVWHGVPGGAQRYNTGGSSGEPLIFYFGRRRQASDAAGRMRARRWWGVEPGEPEVYLWGAPVELEKTDRIKVLRDRLLNQLVLNAFDMSPATMDAYGEAIRAYRPRCIYGYASSVALLAAHLRERGRTPLGLKELRVVCTTGEPLFEHQRQLIGEVFGVPVANEFGSRDIGFTAHETPAGEMLLMSESILLEVLDPQGRPVAPGESGEAVITGLESWAQPFIRYRTGDVLRLSPQLPACGRGLHLIEEIGGRATDFLVRADGTMMHALAGIYVLREVEGVREFKIIQHSVDNVEVLVVPGAAWDGQAQQQIVQGLQRRLGDDVAVRVRPVEEIAPEASGKHRYVVSHVTLEGGLDAALPGSGSK